MEYIQDSISWTDKSEMMIQGEIYPETHIANLVKYSVREYDKYPPKDYARTYKLTMIKNNVSVFPENWPFSHYHKCE